MSREPFTPFDDNESANKQGRSMESTANDVKDRVADITSKVKDKTADMAGSVAQKLGQQRESAAHNLDRMASSIHENAGKLPGGPSVAKATHGVAEGMESAASYLRDHDVNEMGSDLVNLCRRYPAQSLVAALAVGFFIGRSRR